MAAVLDGIASISRDDHCLELSHDVVCVPLSIVNVYLVGPARAGNGDWVLVDAGLPFSGTSIRRAVSHRFGERARPRAIVLTHAHFDHVGVLRDLAEEWDVPVYAHSLELPYLTGRSDYPPPDPSVGGGMMAYLSRLYPRRGIDLRPRVRPLPTDHTVPGMPGWRWIHTPGHTPGHVSFFRDSDRFLIAGDAFVTTKQESALSAISRMPQEVHRPPAYFTSDWRQARNSVRALARLQPMISATGHGTPMRGEEMLQELNELAARFDQIATPSIGRYVREPARADETGTTFVPPPLIEPIAAVVAAIGIGAATGWLTAKTRS